MAYKCELVDYFDVWGNADDGWDVNNISRENTFYMKHEYTDDDMIKKLIDIEYLKSDVNMDNFEIYDDGEVFEAFKADDQMPLFRVELYDIKPIAGLALTNWGGIILEIDDYEETVTYQWYDDEPHTVQYDYDLEAFFIIGDTKYYFYEFIAL